MNSALRMAEVPTGRGVQATPRPQPLNPHSSLDVV